METLLPFPATAPREKSRFAWAPLLVLTTGALFLRDDVPPWALMWVIAVAIFAGFKWWTWRRAVETGAPSTPARSLAYLLLWPGMGARKFLEQRHARRVARTTCCPGSLEAISSEQEAAPTTSGWMWAFAKTLFGATLLWIVARHAGHGLFAGWIGMVGFIFLLHFGLFALLSFFWQGRGINAPPLMNCPIAAKSLHDFWGRRWNAGFHDIVFGLFFVPLARRFSATAAVLLTFVISGLIHELVITIPAGGGYGLPTLYFTLQGAALTLERSRLNVACSRTLGWPGRAFAWAIVVLPIFALFPPVFVLRVMVPFLQVIHALP